jgi:hypothetical protein
LEAWKLMSSDNGGHQRLVQSGVDLDDVASAAVFVVRPGSRGLELSAAAGIGGPPLERLAAALANPDHPITRTLAEAAASYDVPPIAPGGPALRSHLPLTEQRGDRRAVVGVLAVAHEHRLSAVARQLLESLAGPSPSG